MSDPRLRWLRRLLVLHVVLLIGTRALRDVDDFVNWDLTGFLNANAWPSLWTLLMRPEVHLRHPFSFPLYNVGGESVLATLLFRWLGDLSLYWANLTVLFLCDAVFVWLLSTLFRALYRGRPAEVIAWLLVSFSPVLLTFPATSAFNMQGYVDLVLGLLGALYVVQGRAVRGVLLLTLAFLMIAQAYPLAFYLPYFLVAWVPWAVLREQVEEDGVFWRRIVRGVLLLALIGACAYGVNYASDGTYFPKIAPGDPYSAGSAESGSTRLARTVWFFLRQSFWPELRVDGVPVGFAPYFVYGVLLLVGVWCVLFRAAPSPPARRRVLGLLAGVASLGLVLLGYVPAFISVIVKSQRAFLGDLFLVIVVADWLDRLRRRGRLSGGALAALLLLAAVGSDAYYLHFTHVEHAQPHWPRFDFDLSDGVARHDLDAAIETMHQEVEDEGAGLVVYYPRGFAENTTDPAVFFARFLRHFGRYQDRPDVLVPCRWCGVKSCPACGVRYGCPFPDVHRQPCDGQCCYRDPLADLAQQPALAGKRLVLWWWRPPTKEDAIDGLTLEGELVKFAAGYTATPLTAPPAATGWDVYELRPRAPASPVE